MNNVVKGESGQKTCSYSIDPFFTYAILGHQHPELERGGAVGVPARQAEDRLTHHRRGRLRHCPG